MCVCVCVCVCVSLSLSLSLSLCVCVLQRLVSTVLLLYVAIVVQIQVGKQAAEKLIGSRNSRLCLAPHSFFFPVLSEEWWLTGRVLLACVAVPKYANRDV